MSAETIATLEENAQRRRRRRQRETTAEPITRELRRQIIARAGLTCYLCGRALDPSIPGLLTLDHVIPLARGGTHTAGNLRPACADCNCRKGDRLLDELDWYRPVA